MKILDNVKTYIKEDEFKLTVLKDTIDVVNYEKVSHFDSGEIKITYKEGEIRILGTSLVIKRLMKDELLIIGSIERIELR